MTTESIVRYGPIIELEEDIMIIPNVTKFHFCSRPWPAAYKNFNQNIHQIQILTKPLCRAQAIFYSLPNNELGTKYRGFDLHREVNCP